MTDFASNLITTLGGSTAVSRRTSAPVTTVHAWKKNGIPASRLAHLKMVAEQDGIAVDWDTGLAADHGDSDNAAEASRSSGKAGEISGARVSA